VRRWILTTWVGMTLATSQAALTMPADRAFDRIPFRDPAYETVRTMERRGYPTGYPVGMFDGRKPVTRYEFATAVERLFRALRTRVEKARHPGTLPEDLAAFRSLYFAFRADLSPLGTDQSDMLSELEQLSSRVVRLEQRATGTDLLVGAVAPPPGPPLGQSLAAVRPPDPGVRVRAYGPFPDAPLRDPRGPGMPAGSAQSLNQGPLSVTTAAPDRLTTLSNEPFAAPLAGTDYQAMMRVPIGKYLLHGFYQRNDGVGDRFGFFSPYGPVGPTQDFGGGISGSLLSRRLAFLMQSGSQTALSADPFRSLYFRGSLQYFLSSGFGLQVGFERSLDSVLPGNSLDSRTYMASMFKSLGPNARFELQMRRSNRNQFGLDGAANRSFEDTSYFGQFTIRF